MAKPQGGRADINEIVASVQDNYERALRGESAQLLDTDWAEIYGRRISDLRRQFRVSLPEKVFSVVSQINPREDSKRRRLVSYAKAEYKDYISGNKTALSTNSELGKMFEMYPHHVSAEIKKHDPELSDNRLKIIRPRLYAAQKSFPYKKIVKEAEINFLDWESGKTSLFSNKDYCEKYGREKAGISLALKKYMDHEIYERRRIAIARVRYENTLVPYIESLSEEERFEKTSSAFEARKKRFSKKQISAQNKKNGYHTGKRTEFQGVRFQSKSELTIAYLLSNLYDWSAQEGITCQVPIDNIRLDFFMEHEGGRVFLEHHKYTPDTVLMKGLSLFDTQEELDKFKKSINSLSKIESKKAIDDVISNRMMQDLQKRQSVVNENEIYAGTSVHIFDNPGAFYDALLTIDPELKERVAKEIIGYDYHRVRKSLRNLEGEVLESNLPRLYYARPY